MFTLLYLLSFLAQTPLANTLKQRTDACEALGLNLIACQDAADCVYYEISERQVWDVKRQLSIYGSDSQWHVGNITEVRGDVITATIQDCVGMNVDYECTVTNDRRSFVFRDIPFAELVGMRVEVYRDDRWQQTQLTNYGDDDWSDLWVLGGKFGNIVSLAPPELRAYSSQDCLFNPDLVPDIALSIATDMEQVEEATHCTGNIAESDCSLTFNCEWTNGYCLLNNATNEFIMCSKHTSETACESNAPISCKWLEGNDDNDVEDSLCVAGASELSIILALCIFLCFMF